MECWNPKIERLEAEELQELQERKLQRVVENAFEHSIFYKKRFDQVGVSPRDIETLDDVERLLFTYKTDLRDTYPIGMFSVPQNQVVRFHVSSGKTGVPTVVGYTAHDIDVWTTCLARSLTACGLGRGDIVQVAYGYGLFTGGLGLHYGVEEIGAAVLPIGAGTTTRQISLMRDLGTTAIACTPSYLLHISEVAQQMGIDLATQTRLRTGILGAEPWSLESRERIERNVGIKAYDIYGTSEMSGPLFTECTAQDGIHLWADHFLVEIIDGSGKRAKEGESGELVVTTLSKEALPLIRYKMGDVTTLTWEECECGRTHPRIMRIQGRVDDMIVVRGINVFPSQIESVLMQIAEVGDHFQIVVDREGPMDVMTVKVEVTESTLSDRIGTLMKLEERIAKQLRDVLMVNAKIELVEQGTLPRSSGKAKKVIDLRHV
ncbi:MAG: phenylacetate--CoA ligase family protein [Halobacteriota archaeon]